VGSQIVSVCLLARSCVAKLIWLPSTLATSVDISQTIHSHSFGLGLIHSLTTFPDVLCELIEGAESPAHGALSVEGDKKNICIFKFVSFIKGSKGGESLTLAFQGSDKSLIPRRDKIGHHQSRLSALLAPPSRGRAPSASAQLERASAT